jgi:uncharacterized protein
VNRRLFVAGVGFGLLFGFLLSWGRLTDPDVIRDMLVLNEAYVFLMMASAVAVGFVGVKLLLRRHQRALLTGEEVSVRTERPERRHVIGSATFGLGWAIACTCPGPVAAQLGQGLSWGLCTAAGIVGGVLLFNARRGRTARGPALAARRPGAVARPPA